MSADPSPSSGLLPAELPLLLFHAAGAALGVEAAAVEEILDAEAARRAGIASRDLAELLGGAASPASSGKSLLLKGRDARCGIGVDSLDEIVTIPATDLQPLPGPLARSRGARFFWAGIVRANKVVLLVDVDRLREPAPALGEAHA